jgi:hypothetical protein
MTTTEAKNLKPGQYVDYLGAKAMVRSVRSNGVVIDYWGRGLQEGKCVVRRVSASYLKAL